MRRNVQLTPAEVVRVFELISEGNTQREISKKMNISHITVFRYLHNLDTPKSIKDELGRWTKEQEQLLVTNYGLEPVSHIAHSVSKSTSEVYSKINEMKLVRNFIRSCEKQKLKRPPTVYTNIKSPYGIADQIHAGNRIFV